MREPVEARAEVRVRLSALIDEALDRAVEFACRRAFKHRDEAVGAAEDLELLLGDNLRTEFWNALGELGVDVD